jgi:hypothetical protein
MFSCTSDSFSVRIDAGLGPAIPTPTSGSTGRSACRETDLAASLANCSGEPFAVRFMMNAAAACAMSTRAFMKSL